MYIILNCLDACTHFTCIETSAVIYWLKVSHRTQSKHVLWIFVAVGAIRTCHRMMTAIYMHALSEIRKTVFVEWANHQKLHVLIT